MKKFILTLFSAFLLIGCGGNNAESVAKNFVESVYKGDTANVVNLIYLTKQESEDESIKPAVEGKIGMMVSEAMKKAKKRGGFQNIEITDKNIGEDIGEVVMSTSFKDGSTQTERIKVRKDFKGKWKVVIH